MDKSACSSLAYEISIKLNSVGISTWLEYGSALGAVRDGGWAKGDDDIDLGIWWKDWDRMKTIVSEIDANVYFTHCHSGGQFCHIKSVDKNSEVPNKFTGAKGEIEYPRVEIFGFQEDGVRASPINYWGNDNYTPAFKSKAYYQKNLKKIKFEGLYFYVSKYAEKYLDYMYKDVGGEGMTWRTPLDRSEINDWEGDLWSMRNLDTITCYTEGVFDLFHKGHVRLLKRMSNVFDKVYASVTPDEVVKKYKNSPIMPFEDRVEMLESCKYVDEVITSCPNSTYTIDWMEDNGVDYLVHGRTNEEFLRVWYDEIMNENRLFLFDETEGYHTQDLIKKCQIK